MGSTAEEEYKSFMKKCTKGDDPKVVITVRSIRKKLLDMKLKEEKAGNIAIRVHTDDEKAPTWYIHAFVIPFTNLNIDRIKNKQEIADMLNFQTGIVNSETKAFMKKIVKDFGEITTDGRKKNMFRTENFKKQKDYFKVKMKAF
ncbi:MAG: hypothetical protein JW776_06635 [Candidatus Lokiarchaeota archaeon]|nr:hypothetical protein [Candidatus Lokiarchaeota archaeon]